MTTAAATFQPTRPPVARPAVAERIADTLRLLQDHVAIARRLAQRVGVFRAQGLERRVAAAQHRRFDRETHQSSSVAGRASQVRT